MALVGSISGSSGLTAVTSSFVPSASTFNLGTPTNKWGNVYANYITASISSSDGTNPFLKAGSNITVNYNSIGQWEITGAAAVAPSSDLFVFKGLSATTAYSTSSIAIGFSAAANSKGSDVFFAVSGSNPASNTALFSGPVVASGSIAVKDAGVTLGTISGAGVISGSALQSAGDVAVNGGNITTSASTFNIAASAATVNVGSSAGVVVIPGDLEVRGTTMTVSASNLVIEDPLVGFGFLSGSVATSAGDRGFIGGITGAGQNVAFVWSNSNSAFVATKTTSSPSDSTVTLSTLQPVRAASFQVNGTSAAIKEDTGSVIVSGSSVYLDSGNSKVQFMQAGFNQAMYVDSSNLQNPSIVGNAGPGVPNQTLTVSGTSVVVDSFGGTTTVAKGGASFLTVVTGAYTTPAGSTGNAAIVSAAAGAIAVFGGTSGAAISGSAVNLNAGSNGVRIQKDGLVFATFASGTDTNVSLTTANDKKFTVGTAGAGTLSLSGSNGIFLNTPAATGVVLQGDGASLLKISSPSGGQVSVDAQGTINTLTIGGADSPLTTLNLGTGAESLFIGEAASVTTFGGNVIPVTDVLYDLGSTSNRWANIYTGDLHLRNERGDYTLIEEADFLSIRFNKTGKRYKFVLEPVPELDEK